MQAPPKCQQAEASSTIVLCLPGAMHSTACHAQTRRAMACTASRTSTAPTWMATPLSTPPTSGPLTARSTSWAPRA
eukprot:scaffold150832_cov19-Tisochrysis_lutea.AAC.1